MNYISIIREYALPLALGSAGWFFGRVKNRAETRKLQAETDYLYWQKYKEDLEATKSFRELLISENASLVKEINDMKIKYEITTISLKEQIAILTDQLETIMNDREYERCKGDLCETRIAYKKILDMRAKRRAKRLAKAQLEIGAII